MPVGAVDKIDKKLVQMYANTQTNNSDRTSKVDPEEIWRSLSLMAMHNKAYFEIKKNNPVQKKNDQQIA